MTLYRRGDLVPFPFSNLAATKKRPAVVVSSTTYNETSPDIVILAITSRIGKSGGIGECLVQDWQEAGLLKPSAIKPVLSTIEQTLVLKKLGSLSVRDIEEMKGALSSLLGL